MKIISLWQPWASLIAEQLKRYETRTWSTDYRGELLIHAAKRPMDAIGVELCRRFGLPLQLPLGMIVAHCHLMESWRGDEVNASADERLCGDFRDGRYAWALDYVTKLEPIACKGRQNLWTAPPEIVQAVDRQLERCKQERESMARRKKSDPPADENNAAVATQDPDADNADAADTGEAGNAADAKDAKDAKREADAQIAAEREALVLRIMKAMTLEAWGNHPLTREFASHLERQVENEAGAMQAELVSGDKPVSGADQMAFKGRRKALLGVQRQLNDAQRATLDALEAVRRYEDDLSHKLGMHYKAPLWFSYEEQARKRLGDDSEAIETDSFFDDPSDPDGNKADNPDDQGDEGSDGQDGSED